MSINSNFYYKLKKRLEEARKEGDFEELGKLADKLLLALGNEGLTGEEYEKESRYEEEEEPKLGYF